MLIIQTVFKTNFNIFNKMLTVNTYKKVQVSQVTTTTYTSSKQTNKGCTRGHSHGSTGHKETEQTWPTRLLKRKTADLSSVSTQLYQGGICRFCEFLVFIFSKKNNFFSSFSEKKKIFRNARRMLNAFA